MASLLQLSKVGTRHYFRHIASLPVQQRVREQEPLQSWVSCFTTGERLGIISLNNEVFGNKPRLDLIHRVVVWQLAKRRSGTAKVKDRSEVRGGGRKPWQQKGLGKARQGSIRAPQWRGGGVVHGPRGPVSYYYTLPKSVRKLGLCAALSVKYGQGDLYIVDDLSLETNKTKHLLNILSLHSLQSVLLVGNSVNMELALATNNLPEVDILPLDGLNVYSIMLRHSLVLSLGAVRCLEEKLCNYY